ncbi:MAG: hypothetical protein R3D98_11525 [Candidatus Krumholzibacteriia bacterium]
MPDRDPRVLPADDLLAAYEMDLLDPADRARVEAALLADPDLLDELYDAAPETSLLLATPGRFAAAARAGLVAAGSTPLTLRRRLGRWLRPRLLVPAALVAALAVVLLWPSGGHLPGSELASVAPLPTMQVELRNATDQADTRFQEGMALYRTGDWTTAAAAFAAALAAAEPGWSRQHQAQLYAGSSRLLDGRARDALVLLEDAAGSPLPPIREQALWQVVQARLILGQTDQAREALAVLAASPVFGQRATTLLDQLGDGR